MKRAIPIAVVTFVLVLAGCSSSKSDPTPSAALSAVPVQHQQETPVFQLDDVARVGGPGEGDMSEVTVSHPRTENGHYAVGVLIKDDAGDSLVPGTFMLLTTAGEKLGMMDVFMDYSVDPPAVTTGQLDISGTMVPGETRYGWVGFQVPQGDSPKTLFLYHGEIAPPVGKWDLG